MMKSMRTGIVVAILFAALTLTACAVLAPSPTPTPTAAPTRTPVPPTATPFPTSTLAPSATLTPTEIPTPDYPAEGRGPSDFATDVNPLTGLQLDDPTLLDRRPLVIKIENLPRDHRPQFGLGSADLVYEYYTEQGGTRFAAVYYGQDSERVGPIRSGRFFDVNVVEMYRGIFVFGSAYEAVWNRFLYSSFYNRLIIENQYSCPALCRFEPAGRDLLVADTTAMNEYLRYRGTDNSRQVLDGMFFQMQPPEGGSQAEQVFVRYSGAIYNRWDYDPSLHAYLRFSDSQNDVNRNNEVYAQLTDGLTEEPIKAENVVTFCVAHQYYSRTDEIEVVTMLMEPGQGYYVGCDGESYPTGSGPAWIARDGKIYKVKYQRTAKDQPVTLVDEDGQPFPFKPGQTWFEVIGASSDVVEESTGVWRFTFAIVP